jgi:hypothetical protein
VKRAKLTCRKIRANRINGRKSTGPKPNGGNSGGEREPGTLHRPNAAVPKGASRPSLRRAWEVSGGRPARILFAENQPKANDPPFQNPASPDPKGQSAPPSAETGGLPPDNFDFEAVLRSLGGALDDAICPQSIRLAVAAMEEDPAQFARLHQDLIDEWQPSTPTLRKLVLRLAYLIWRQERAQRAQDGVMLCRMNNELNTRAQRMLQAVSAPAEMVLPDAKDALGLRQAVPSEAKFERLLDWLGSLLSLLDALDFSHHWELLLHQIYGTKLSWRAEYITEWARQLAHYFAHAPEAPAAGEGARPTAEGPGGAEAKAPPEGWQPPRRAIATADEKDEVLRQLRRELAEEHRDVITEYQLYKALNVNFPWYLRTSLFAPQDKYWGTVIWQEQSLGQQIESTLRMIISLKAREAPQPNPAQGGRHRRR